MILYKTRILHGSKLTWKTTNAEKKHSYGITAHTLYSDSQSRITFAVSISSWYLTSLFWMFSSCFLKFKGWLVNFLNIFSNLERYQRWIRSRVHQSIFDNFRGKTFKVNNFRLWEGGREDWFHTVLYLTLADCRSPEWYWLTVSFWLNKRVFNRVY